MWQKFVGVILGLAILPAAAGGQPAGVGDPVGKEVPLLLAASEPSSAFIRDPRDGSVVVWGHRQEREPTCVPGTRAFVARLGENGSELWRRNASMDPDDLFAGLTSLDPRHILASKVHGVAADPVTGQLYAVAEALVAWESGDCELGVATAVNTLVLGLAPDGTPVNDATLGTLPDGPPPAAFTCDELCTVDRQPQTVGRGISVGTDGEVVVAGYRRTAGRDEIFAARLGSDLSQRAGGSLSLPFSQDGGLGKGIPMTVCPPPTDPSRNILSVHSTTPPVCFNCLDKEHLYVSDEGCTIRIEVAEELEAKFEVSLSPTELQISLKLDCVQGSVCAVRLELKDQSLGDWVQIGSTLTTVNGTIDNRTDPVVVDEDVDDYVDAADRVYLRLIVGSDSNAERGTDSDVDLDELDVDS